MLFKTTSTSARKKNKKLFFFDYVANTVGRTSMDENKKSE
jgi:hypothetical protein